MMKIHELTPKDIDFASYNELIGIIRETNRPPGGYKTVETICKNAFISPHKRILEIGTSTGFTAIEIARLTKANITAIDINPLSLEEARARANLMGLKEHISFESNDATNLPYDSNSFDVVFCGNVTSYIPNREKALSEYIRVTKEGGLIAAVPMYYLSKPDDSLVERVSEAIKFKITPEFKLDWTNFFERSPLVKLFSEDYRFEKISDDRIEAFTDEILKRPHLLDLKDETSKALKTKYSSQIRLFRDNLSLMGYSILLFRKDNFRVDEELFTGEKI